jgi:hypothetical protein
MSWKVFVLFTLISVASTGVAPKIEEVLSGEEYSSRPLSYKNYGSFLHEHSLVFVKFFTNW